MLVFILSLLIPVYVKGRRKYFRRQLFVALFLENQIGFPSKFVVELCSVSNPQSHRKKAQEG